MEKERKELKWLSILVLAFVGLTIIRAIVNVCVNGLPQVTEIPEGMTKDAAQLATTIAFVLSFVLLLPQIYVGVKGLKIANGANGGKAHIIWALILAILAGISVISGISKITKGFNLDSVINLLDPIIDLLLFATYYIYARKIAKAK